MLVGLLLLSGCGRPSEVPASSDPGWTVGEAMVCDPAGIGWDDAGLDVEDFAPPEGYRKAGLDGGGGIALIDVDGRRLLYWTRHDGGDARGGSVGARDLEGGFLPDPPLADVTALSVGDLDADGVLDLVGVSDPLQVLFSAGTAAERVASYPTEIGELRDVAVGDFDGDGIEDLYLARTSSTKVTEAGAVWLGVGDGTFDPVVLDVPEEWWGRPFDARALDRDGDGDLDVFLCNDAATGGQSNGWLDNPGDGRLVGLDARLAATPSCMGQDWGDLDGDGVLDLLVADAVAPYVFLEGEISAARAYDLPGFVFPSQMGWGARVGDLDADGDADFAMATSDFWYDGAQPWPLVIGLQGDGRFEISEPADAHGHGLIVTDADGDGGLDLLLGDSTRSPWWLRSRGCPAGAWIDVEAPHGSVARVEAGGEERVGLVSSDASYASAGPTVLRIGVGDVEEVDRVILAVPNVGEVRLEGPIPARTRVRWAP